MRPFRLLRTLIPLLLLLVGLACGQAATDSVQNSVPDFKIVGDLGSELFVESGATGMVLVVVRGDEVFVRDWADEGR